MYSSAVLLYFSYSSLTLSALLLLPEFTVSLNDFGTPESCLLDIETRI
jgi:hypothetical protein